MSEERSNKASWSASLVSAGRRVFPNAGTHAPTPAQRASALLTFIQRADLRNLEGQALEDATAQLVVIHLDGSPLPFDRHPKVNGPELAEFAERLRGTLEQLKLPGNSGPRQSGLIVSQELRHIMLWDPGRRGPAQSFFSGPFIIRALLRGRMLLGEHMDKIERCQRCDRFLMVQKGAKFCSLQCAQNARAARFLSNLDPKRRKRVRQRDYFQRLRRKDPAIAEQYLSRLRKTDPAAARSLKSWATGKKQTVRKARRSRSNEPASVVKILDLG